MADNNYVAFLNIIPDITNQSIWSRLIAQLPPWFGNQQTFADAFLNQSSTNLNTTLWAFNIVDGNISNALNPDPPQSPTFAPYQFYGNYAQYQYIVTQMRLGPGEDSFFPDNINPALTDQAQLNLFAQDFFGNGLPRYPMENNASYKLRIFANLLNLRATRAGMFDALFNLTGNAPIIFEPNNIYDAMFYGYDTSGLVPISHCAYGHGRYGSIDYPYEAYIDVFLSPTQALGTYYPGYNLPAQPSVGSFPPYPVPSLGGFGVTQILGSQSLIQGNIGQQQVVNTINQTKVFGTLIWFRISYASS